MSFEYDKLFEQGDQLILELKTKEIYEGIYADGGKDRIVITNVVQHNNNNKLSGLYEFYRNEIQKIHTLKLPPTKVAPKPEEPDISEKCHVIKICEKDYTHLKEMSTNYVYIENADQRYFDAVKVLANSETIGVVSLGMEKQRLGSLLRLLVLCTWKQVYIFDLINLENRKIYPEIKELFESEYVCKVIHKSGGLVDVLYRHYNVYVQNTFDTQIVDLILQKSHSGSCPIERNLSECLVHYMNFPASLLEQALEITNKQWNERPLPNKLKLYASQLATYLIILKEYFQKLLLKDVYDTIVKVQDHVYDVDDFEFLNYTNKKQVSKSVQNLIPALEYLKTKED